MTQEVIAFATELSGDDHVAFLHACAIAAAAGSRLVSIHANAPGELASQIPDATPFATRWGKAIDYRRVCHQCCDDVTDTLLDAIRGLTPQLVICGTHARRGFAALVRNSIAAELARNVEVPVLVVPNDADGFIDPETGNIALRELIVPAGTRDEAARGVRAARSLTAFMNLNGVSIEIVHTGNSELDIDALGVSVIHETGTIESAILAATRGRARAAIVMVTHGHDSVRDVVAGSHTEHVIRDAHLPVLSVHA